MHLCSHRIVHHGRLRHFGFEQRGHHVFQRTEGFARFGLGRSIFLYFKVVPFESQTRTYHGRDGAWRRTAAGRAVRVGLGGTGRARAGFDGGGSLRPGCTCPSCPPANRGQASWTALRKHEQMKPFVNRTGEHNERLTSGSPAGRRPLMVPGCCEVDRRVLVAVNLFLQCIPGTC